MKKTIIKTALITALLLLCSVFIIYFATYIVSPGTIGDMYKNLGMKNNAVEMYEKQYLSKGNAFDDLKELVDMAIAKGLTAFALTDHDTTAGVKEAVAYG